MSQELKYTDLVSWELEYTSYISRTWIQTSYPEKLNTNLTSPALEYRFCILKAWSLNTDLISCELECTSYISRTWIQILYLENLNTDLVSRELEYRSCISRTWIQVLYLKNLNTDLVSHQILHFLHFKCQIFAEESGNNAFLVEISISNVLIMFYSVYKIVLSFHSKFKYAHIQKWGIGLRKFFSMTFFSYDVILDSRISCISVIYKFPVMTLSTSKFLFQKLIPVWRQSDGWRLIVNH